MAMTRSSFIHFIVLLVLLLYLVVFTSVAARKHALKLTYDYRNLVILTDFGFLENGYFAVKVSEISFPGNDNNAYGFTLEKFQHSQSEFFSSWNSEESACPLTNLNDVAASIVFFVVEFKHSIPLQMRIIRNGDLKNLTITLQDLIRDNPTEGERWKSKRRAYKVPLSPFTHKKRAAEKIANDSISAAPTSAATVTEGGMTLSGEPDFVSVDIIPITPHRYSYDHGVRYEVHFAVWFTNAKDMGQYSLVFHNCRRTSVNLTVEMAENNNGNFLSVGQMPLPIMYFVLSTVYFLVGSIWFYILCSSQEGVFKIHYLILAVMYIKSTSLLFHGVNFHVIEVKGQKQEAFAILFYIVYVICGIFMFATIVLIGAGWTLVKRTLSGCDKKIFVIVILLQILINFAAIILSESEKGQSTYNMWKDSFILFDLLCCGLILFPVVRSIRHLRQASQTVGHEAINLEKLKIFQHFRCLLVCYIFFTRLIVLMLSITIPYRYEWLDECFVEVATLVFFLMTSYKFRPASYNPWLQVPRSDDENWDESVI